MFNYKNYASRTEVIRSMKVGDTVLIVPYNAGEYAREQSSLKATATKERMTIELKQVLIVTEGEIPQPFMRVTRTK